MPTLRQEIEFSDLLKRNYHIINRVCLKFCGGNAFYFDELRQECALVLWKEFSQYGLDRFRGESKETTWIYQISYHAIVDYYRNPNHREFRSIFDQYSMENLSGDEQLSSELSLEDSLIWEQAAREDWHLLDEILEHLDNKERNLLDYYLSDNSYSSIARDEGITESSVRKQMSRLFNKLKMLIHK